jgi:hypothetical protein
MMVKAMRGAVEFAGRRGEDDDVFYLFLQKQTMMMMSFVCS